MLHECDEQYGRKYCGYTYSLFKDTTAYTGIDSYDSETHRTQPRVWSFVGYVYQGKLNDGSVSEIDHPHDYLVVESNVHPSNLFC